MIDIRIQAQNLTPREDLLAFIDKEVNRLSRFYKKIEAAHVFLKVEKADGGADKFCEIRLAIPGNDLFAKKHAETFEEATSKVVSALQEQIQKVKTKLEAHHIEDLE